MMEYDMLESALLSFTIPLGGGRPGVELHSFSLFSFDVLSLLVWQQDIHAHCFNSHINPS